MFPDSLNCKKGDNFQLILVLFNLLPDPDTQENCDLGYSAHFLWQPQQRKQDGERPAVNKPSKKVLKLPNKLCIISVN